ncbi:MAG: SMC-Scp complex subunit ScpB [Oscillospiraceae bacterium]|nr:SMC-Scp complex subunit ScpB [Oscillospiraceae bacterium]
MKKEILGAVLFASGDGVNISKLCEILELRQPELAELVGQCKNSWPGLEIKQIGEKYCFATKPEFAEHISKIIAPKILKPLSSAAIETLAIIAYKQPITRGFIEKIRGVESKFSIIKLLESDFIEEVGRLAAPGRPVLYGTTDEFLKVFGFATTDELPPLEDFAEKALETDIISNEQLVISNESGISCEIH